MRRGGVSDPHRIPNARHVPNFFSAPAGGGLFKGPARRACPVVVCGQGGCLSPLLRGWWPKVVVAPPVHVHVLVVQIAFLLFAVVARVVPPVVWVGARVAPLHEHELPVVQELPRPREVHHESEVRHQLALLPRNRMSVFPKTGSFFNAAGRFNGKCMSVSMYRASLAEQVMEVARSPGPRAIRPSRSRW